MRRTLIALTVSLMGTAALAGGLGEMSDAERAAFRAEVRAYLVENPEVLVEALDVMQTREEQAALARDVQMLSDNKEAIYNDAASYVGGNPEGDITVVEFMDYRCGYCRKAHEEVSELIETDGNIRFILKEFPILSEESVTLARFAVAVLQLHGNAPYEAAHDALYAQRGVPDEAALTALAQDLGLDPAPILARMSSDEVTAVLKANHALADIMEISGTPSYVIDNSMLRGYVPLDGMRQIVDAQRKS